MGYAKINNLYRDQGILMFKECYALEKIHGTSAHITFNPLDESNLIRLFSGGESHEKFAALFDTAKLAEIYKTIAALPLDRPTTIYGEAYGGKQQGMSATYGPNLRFIVFDVQVGETWLNVLNAHDVATKFGLEFVDYVKIPTTLEAIDAERDKPSVQAVRNGITEPKKREGVVLRPLVEVNLSSGARIYCKHKHDDFRETKSPRPVVDPNQIELIQDAERAADEFVTNMRLEHVLQKIPNHSMEQMALIIRSMIEDIRVEGAGEVVMDKTLEKIIAKKTVTLYKGRLQNSLTTH